MRTASRRFVVQAVERVVADRGARLVAAQTMCALYSVPVEALKTVLPTICPRGTLIQDARDRRADDGVAARLHIARVIVDVQPHAEGGARGMAAVDVARNIDDDVVDAGGRCKRWWPRGWCSPKMRTAPQSALE